MTTPKRDVKTHGAKLEKHHDISAFAAADSEKIKYAIDGIYYNPDTAELVATDRCTIIIVDVGPDEGMPCHDGLEPLQEQTLIPVEPFRRAMKRIRKNAKNLVEHDMLLTGRARDGTQRVALVTSDLSSIQEITALPANHKDKRPYPDYTKHMPKVSPLAKMRLASNQLRKLADYAKSHGGGAVEFFVYPQDPQEVYPPAVGFKIDLTESYNATARGIVMQCVREQ